MRYLFPTLEINDEGEVIIDYENLRSVDVGESPFLARRISYAEYFITIQVEFHNEKLQDKELVHKVVCSGKGSVKKIVLRSKQYSLISLNRTKK